MTSISARLDALEAAEEIRQVLYRFARGVDRGDPDIIKSAYHLDAVDVHGITFAGNAHDFADYISESLDGSLTNHHAVSNPLIELDGDRAFVESYFTATHRVPLAEHGEAIDVQAEGRYLDVFERRSGTWKIAHRLVVTDKFWSKPARTDGTAPRPPEALRQAIGDRSDPVYRGFDIVEVSPPAYAGPNLVEVFRRLGATPATDAAAARPAPSTPRLDTPPGADAREHVYQLAGDLGLAAQHFSDAVYRLRTLPAREFEAARARIARVNGCERCMAFRVGRDRPVPGDEDVPESFYDEVERWSTAEGWSLRERLAAEVAERFALDNASFDTDEDLWDRLHAAFSDAELAQLVLSIASFTGLGRLSRVLGVDGVCELPDPSSPPAWPIR